MINYLEQWIKKRIAKREQLEVKLTEAKEKGQDWKVIQIQTKIAKMNNQDNPQVFWNSGEKGTYRKPMEVQEDEQISQNIEGTVQ